MKKVLLILLVVFTTNILSSQNYKFGDVSKEELQETVYPLDSSANAAILYKERKTSFEYVPNQGFNVITQVFLRLKIYNKEGFDWATNKISYYNSSNEREMISGLKAITYNLEKNKIVETKLSRKDIFDEERNKYWSQQKFTMPNIKEGSVIEWRYKLTSPFKRIDDVQFQYEIPVKKMNASVEIPEYFIYKKQFKGYHPVFAKTETKSRSINFTEKERNVRDITSRATFSEVKIDLLSKLETYEVSNIPALIEEAYVNNIENYKTAIQYEYSELHWPREPIKYYSHSWEDVVKTIYKNYDFGSEIYKSNHYSDDLAVILAAAKTDSEKIVGIFEFVKQKVKWNKYNGITKFNGTRKAYKEAVGNVFDINLNLVSMLNKAGLEANPVILSTRAHGISFFPTIDGFNYVVAAVKLPEGLVLLDATEKYSTPNILPFRALNGEGRLIRDNGSSETVSLDPVKPAATVTILRVEIDEEGIIKGQNRTNYLNHQALNYREKYAAIKNDDIVIKLEENKGGLEISDFELSGKKEAYKPVMETYKFYSENLIDVVGDKMFFKPLFFEATTTSPFKLKKREYPINFGTTLSSKTLVNILIPEGYVIESIPESIYVKLPNNYGSYKFYISTSGNIINVSSHFKIDTISFPTANYEELKEFYKMVIDKSLETIVLTKG